MKPNPQQQAVIDHIDGPCLVTAVPGSGKTASVTERVKNMISKGVEPSSILAITFTKKAAEEMKSRIAAAVGVDKASKMIISTFHSMCARMIRFNCVSLGLAKNFTIYDEDDQERLLKRCVSKVEDKPEVRDDRGRVVHPAEEFNSSKEYEQRVLSYIEGMRNACLKPEQAAQKYELVGNQAKVAEMYFAELRKANAVDFTGLLSETIRLFDENPGILEKYRAKFKYISVDEVQDTNVAQYRIIQQLGGGHKNVLVVGDLDQSVYRFRNASPENILDFERDFGARVLKLETNYRSTPEILKHSQNLIEKNKMRKSTVLTTGNASGDQPQVVGHQLDEEMACWIANEVRGCLRRGVPASEIAILYRVNSASRILENKLREKGIRYKVIGGLDFFSRKEIKVSLAILRMLANETDAAAFEKACEFCCRGVGNQTITKILDHANEAGVSVTQASRDYASKMGNAQARGLTPLVNAMDAGRAIRPDLALMSVARETCFWDKMAEDSTDTNDRTGNIEEMARDVEKWVGQGGTLSGYLQNVMLLTSADQNAEGGEVKMMTMHACKGLEFDVVFVSHANNEIIPHARTLAVGDEKERGIQIEEERRLLYVAMTRARKMLRLCFCRLGMNKEMEPSPFLYETGLRVPHVPPPPVKKSSKKR